MSLAFCFGQDVSSEKGLMILPTRYATGLVSCLSSTRILQVLRKAISRDLPGIAEEIALLATKVMDEVDIAMVRRAIKDFPTIILALIHFGGGHFEPKHKEFKRQRKASAEICDRCGEVHYCHCESCNNACSRDEEDDMSSISDYLEWDSDISSLNELDQDDLI